MGTAPLSMTTRVCSEVPEATFVSAHAASNCIQRNLVSPAPPQAVPAIDNLGHAKSTASCSSSSHLQWGKIASLQELHKPRDDALADYFLDGRVALCSSASLLSFNQL